ncbi:MAG: hypothetical protein ACYCYO_00130 [Bacilli bacterium]
MIAVSIVSGVLMLLFLIWRDRKKTACTLSRTTVGRKGRGSLQTFLPLERFHKTGTMVVQGQFRRMIRVGDANLYALSTDEVVSVRNRFQDMLKHLNEPFQISVQARRANYRDFLAFARDRVGEAQAAYDHPAFVAYTESLLAFVQEEAAKPRTDRENLFVVGVVPKLGGEQEDAQLERLDRELNYVASGLHGIGLPFEILEEVQQVEAIQNFWSRERAVTERYRDLVRAHMHAPVVKGEETIVRTPHQSPA